MFTYSVMLMIHGFGLDGLGFHLMSHLLLVEMDGWLSVPADSFAGGYMRRIAPVLAA